MAGPRRSKTDKGDAKGARILIVEARYYDDIADFLQQPAAGEDSSVFRFLRGIAVFAKPLIASVCGPAVGVDTGDHE